MSGWRGRDQDRREFLKLLAGGAACAGAAGLGLPLLEQPAEAAKKVRVVLVHGTDPQRMLASAIRVFQRALAPRARGKRVVIKPNMSFKNPAAWGNNTSPEVAVAVAQLCKEWGAAQVTAIDHPLSGGPRAMKVCGVQPALEKLGGVQVMAAHRKVDYVPRPVPKGKALKRTAIPKALAESDLLINVPVVKQHNATKVSAGLKNLMGLVWDRRHFHEAIDLHQGIADLTSLLQPALTVIDATRVMVSNGPQGPGEVQKLQALVVSDDPVAADAVAIGLTQWRRQRLSPGDVAHLQAAAKLGLGVADLSRIKVIKKRV